MEFYWTTLTSGYDMNISQQEDISSQRESCYLPNIRTIIYHNEQPSDAHFSRCDATEQQLSLPKIIATRYREREDLYSASQTAPAPPNTALAFSR